MVDQAQKGPPGRDGSGEHGAASQEASAQALSSASSPSLAFLRDLAHVSDEAPDAFALQLAADAPPPASSRFVAKKRLGAGGFGTVYEALDRTTNAGVAVKMLRRRDPRAISRFKREFRSFVEIVHENLVQLYELHAEGDAWFFTMELLHGRSAIEHVRATAAEGALFDEQRVRDVFRQLAAGLSFLHQAGKLHRDVKPSNVIVTAEGRVVLLDFGLVTDIADDPIGEGVLGTPAYMAPEQAAGLPVGTAADWYAVGVMLYEALTGRLPFEPGRARAPTPPAPSEVASVPADLDRLCVDLLQRAPERRPNGREVRRRLTSHDARERPRRDAPVDAFRPAPFIGRAHELRALHEAFAEARNGRAVVALVRGPSGMGKSALLHRFLLELRAREPSCTTLVGRCFEQESVPYKAVDSLVDDLCKGLQARPAAEIRAVLPPEVGVLARLFPQIRQIPGVAARAAQGPDAIDDDQTVRRSAFAALRELLRRMGACPVLAVDDVQWGDLDSVALLVDLLASGDPQADSMLLVASYRAEEADTNPVLRAFSEALAGDRCRRVVVRTLDVGQLDDVEAEALSRALLEADGTSGDPLAERAVRAIASEGRGDPFLIAELARHHARTRRASDTTDRDDHSVAPALQPQDAGGLLARRIDRLPEPARRLLEVVAVAGQPISRADAAHAAFGDEPERELSALALLRANRLVRVQHAHHRQELLPYHDRIRENVTARLGADARRAHHHRLAVALEASGTTEPERLLLHFRHADRPADALRYATKAAALAHEALAFDRAARLYGEALRLGAPPAEARALRMRLGDALSAAGRSRDAADAYLAAAADAAPADSLVARKRAAEHLLGAGYLDEGLHVLRTVLREVGLPPPSSPARSLLGLAALRLRLQVRGLGFRERPESSALPRELARVDACAAAARGLVAINPLLAAESQARHLLVALEVGEPYRVGRALAVESIVTHLRHGRAHAHARRTLGTARAIAARLDHPHLAGLVALAEGLGAIVSGQWRTAHDALAASESILRARCTGVWSDIDTARLQRATCLWMLGDLEQLAELVPELVEDARERGDHFVETAARLTGEPLCALTRDRPDLALAAIDAARARWPIRPGSFQRFRETLSRARVALYTGDGRAARAALAEAWPGLRNSGLLFTPALGAELRFVRALASLATGDLRAAAADARVLERTAVPFAPNASLIVDAALARRSRDTRRALRVLEQAELRARANGVALFAAALRRCRGELIAGSEGRRYLESADTWMTARGIVNPSRMTRMLVGDAG